MTVVATRAAKMMAAEPNEISPHRVIALLLDGALERIGQAKKCLAENNQTDFEVLLVKTVGILNGLRSSLDFEKGGEIAANLDSIYDYVADKLIQQHNPEALVEAEHLLSEIKLGWDGITDEAIRIAK